MQTQVITLEQATIQALIQQAEMPIQAKTIQQDQAAMRHPEADARIHPEMMQAAHPEMLVQVETILEI